MQATLQCHHHLSEQEQLNGRCWYDYDNIYSNFICERILMWKSQHKDSNTPSFKSLMIDERISPVEILLDLFSALILLDASKWYMK